MCAYLLSWYFMKRASLILVEGDLQFLSGVHYDRSVPRDRLAYGLAGNKQETDAFFLGRDHHLLAVIEDHETVVAIVGFLSMSK